MLWNFVTNKLQPTIAKHFQENWWPAYKRPYNFTTDWFTYRIAVWREILGSRKGQENLRALEVGTFEGRSALWLMENILTSKTAKLTCIDPYPLGLEAAEKRFLENIKLGQFESQVEFIKECSQNILPTLPYNHFDLIYIDGHHEGEQIAVDGEFCWRLLKTGGILIFDDYEWPIPLKGMNPKEAIDLFLKKYAAEVTLLHKGYQVIIQKK